MDKTVPQDRQPSEVPKNVPTSASADLHPGTKAGVIVLTVWCLLYTADCCRSVCLVCLRVCVCE